MKKGKKIHEGSLLGRAWITYVESKNGTNRKWDATYLEFAFPLTHKQFNSLAWKVISLERETFKKEVPPQDEHTTEEEYEAMKEKCLQMKAEALADGVVERHKLLTLGEECTMRPCSYYHVHLFGAYDLARYVDTDFNVDPRGILLGRLFSQTYGITEPGLANIIVAFLAPYPHATPVWFAAAHAKELRKDYLTDKRKVTEKASEKRDILKTELDKVLKGFQANVRAIDNTFPFCDKCHFPKFLVNKRGKPQSREEKDHVCVKSRTWPTTKTALTGSTSTVLSRITLLFNATRTILADYHVGTLKSLELAFPNTDTLEEVLWAPECSSNYISRECRWTEVAWRDAHKDQQLEVSFLAQRLAEAVWPMKIAPSEEKSLMGGGFYLSLPPTMYFAISEVAKQWGIGPYARARVVADHQDHFLQPNSVFDEVQRGVSLRQPLIVDPQKPALVGEEAATVRRYRLNLSRDFINLWRAIRDHIYSLLLEKEENTPREMEERGFKCATSYLEIHPPSVHPRSLPHAPPLPSSPSPLQFEEEPQEIVVIEDD